MESPDLKAADGERALLVSPPGFLAHWRVRILLACFLMVPFFVPIPQVLKFHPVISVFGDRLHVVLLGGTALFLYWYGPLRGRLLRALIGAAVIGGLIELLQTQVGRHALWHDFYQDLIGIGIVAGFLLWRGRGSRAGLALMVILLLVVPYQMRELPGTLAGIRFCREHFPVLADFEDSVVMNIWSDDDGGRLQLGASDEAHGQVLKMDTGPSRQWPGAVMRRFPSDWSKFDHLRVDVRLVETPGDTLRGGLILSDRDGYENKDWWTWKFPFTGHWQTIEIPLQELLMESGTRDLDLTDVFSMKIYLSQPATRATVEIDNLRLE